MSFHGLQQSLIHLPLCRPLYKNTIWSISREKQFPLPKQVLKGLKFAAEPPFSWKPKVEFGQAEDPGQSWGRRWPRVCAPPKGKGGGADTPQSPVGLPHTKASQGFPPPQASPPLNIALQHRATARRTVYIAHFCILTLSVGKEGLDSSYLFLHHFWRQAKDYEECKEGLWRSRQKFFPILIFTRLCHSWYFEILCPACIHQWNN